MRVAIGQQHQVHAVRHVDPHQDGGAAPPAVREMMASKP